MTVSATEEGSPGLINLVGMLTGFPPQDVEGPEDLVQTKIRADWIVRAGASAEEVIAALNPILRQQCKLPVRLAIGEKEREIVVARGRFRPRPLIEGRVAIELYGATLTLGGGNEGCGGLTEFLSAAGGFIEPRRHIVDEVEGRPEGDITWHMNFRTPFDEKTKREERGEEVVLRHISEQTGLSFSVERRKISILSVERSE
jgi:hypothetical protein